MIAWRCLPVAAALLLSACTSSTGGASRASTSGGASRTSTLGGTSGPLSGSSGSTASLPSSPTSNPVPTALVRAPRDTAIGDPATADLCAAVGLGPFGHLRPGVTASFDAVQYPPGCSVTVADARGPVLAVSVFAAKHGPRDVPGRQQRTASGLPVYEYPFDKTKGSCERDLTADHVRLVVDSLTRSAAATTDAKFACAATNVMTDALAAAVEAGEVPRLALAQPSVTEFSACAVAKQAGITSLGDFATARLIRRGFSVNCELKTAQLFLFINVAVATAQAALGTPKTVDGHQIFEVESRPGLCSYESEQGETADGRHERITAAATTSADAKPPPELCAQTAEALAMYLTAAGLS